MSEYLGFWIRKNKNVQVRCHWSVRQKDGTELLTIIFRNGHVKHMKPSQLLEGFINLDDLLTEITKDSRWVCLSTKLKIQVKKINVRLGIVHFDIEGVPKEYSHSNVSIQSFKNLFQPELI